MEKKLVLAFSLFLETQSCFDFTFTFKFNNNTLNKKLTQIKSLLQDHIV